MTERPALLAAPDPRWPAQAAACIAQIQATCPGAVLEHIGSTAVPELPAKPVIDLLLGAATLAQIEAWLPALTALGYRYRPEHEAALPERRYCVRDADAATPRVHLHGLVQGAALWRRHLLLRDALRAHPALRQAYAVEKRRQAAQHAQDKAAYQAGKAPFIVAVLQQLEASACQ